MSRRNGGIKCPVCGSNLIVKRNESNFFVIEIDGKDSSNRTIEKKCDTEPDTTIYCTKDMTHMIDDETDERARDVMYDYLIRVVR